MCGSIIGAFASVVIMVNVRVAMSSEPALSGSNCEPIPSSALRKLIKAHPRTAA